jgi:hypothetical protein
MFSCVHIFFKINISLIQTTRAPQRTNSLNQGGGGLRATVWEPLLYGTNASNSSVLLTGQVMTFWFDGSGSWTVTPCDHGYLKYAFCRFTRNVRNHVYTERRG